jgi:hypothetical protein
MMRNFNEEQPNEELTEEREIFWKARNYNLGTLMV